MSDTGPASGPRTVAEALRLAASAGLPRGEAQLLLAEALGRSRAWLIAHDDDPLPPELAARCADWIARRAAGEPHAYIVGTKEFHGLLLQVSPAVLIPRPDTETLVDWAIELLDGALSAVAHPRVLDLGTGSGAIALAVRHAVPRAEVAALDASTQALAVAQANGERLGLAVRWQRSDWWRDAPPGPWHLALSNPPYIAEGDPHLPALAHEPRQALTALDEGLRDLQQVIDGAAQQLLPDGWLLLEHGHDQGPAVQERMRSAGFETVTTRRDLGGRDRCTGGHRPGA